MSTQKGNGNRTRPQKYQNSISFKNNLHDTSKEIKQLNTLTYEGLCKRCHEIIAWRIKYKKYNTLTQPKTCLKCKQKAIKQAYHTICSPCSSKLQQCAKCGQKINDFTSKIDQSKINEEFESALKSVNERERRTLLRISQRESACGHKNLESDDLENEIDP